MSKGSIMYNRAKIQKCLSDAMRLAIKAHANQTDKTGSPYINHVLEVASYGQTEIERITGLLHDIIEDGGYSAIDLRYNCGFPSVVVNAVKVLTRREDETYSAYIYRVFQGGELPSIVKMYDFMSNCNPDRVWEYSKVCDFLPTKKYYENAAYLSELYAQEAKIDEWVGKDISTIIFPNVETNQSMYTMNMEKFIKPDFFNYPDYILTPSAIADISMAIEQNKDLVEEIVEEIVTKAICINPVESQPYVYIQVPAFVAAFNFEKLRAAIFEDSGQDLEIIRRFKYPAKGAYFEMIDVAIYNAGPTKIGSSNADHGYSNVKRIAPWNKFKVDKAKKEKEFTEAEFHEKMSEFAQGVVEDAKLGIQ